VTSPIASTPATGTPISSAPKEDLASLKKVAQQFEAVFLRQMIGSMRQASLGDGILDSSATETFRDMSDSRVADNMASKGVLHVADLLVKQFGARLSGTAAGATGAAAKGDAK
jgi:flagellar protein FlgJ